MSRRNLIKLAVTGTKPGAHIRQYNILHEDWTPTGVTCLCAMDEGTSDEETLLWRVDATGVAYASLDNALREAEGVT